MTLPKAGTSFEVIVTITENGSVKDISTATEKKIFLEPWQGTVLERDAEFVTDGTDGQMKYKLTLTDSDTPGFWRVQGKVVISSEPFYTEIGSFRVGANLIMDRYGAGQSDGTSTVTAAGSINT